MVYKEVYNTFQLVCNPKFGITFVLSRTFSYFLSEKYEKARKSIFQFSWCWLGPSSVETVSVLSKFTSVPDTKNDNIRGGVVK